MTIFNFNFQTVDSLGLTDYQNKNIHELIARRDAQASICFTSLHLPYGTFSGDHIDVRFFPKVLTLRYAHNTPLNLILLVFSKARYLDFNNILRN